MSNITLAEARQIIDAAIAKSKSLGSKMNIAIVDSGTNLVAFNKMDDAWLGSIDISQKKARTARYFNMDTGIIGSLSQPGSSLYNIEHSNDGLITFPGGVVIKNASGEIIGAIGVSGSTVEDDHAVAVAGAQAIL
ncbi:GlcG/HbpS family heme-binding protein [Sphingobacterium composti Ten et al. 2007 non Yoo et al. 2007]|uniref:GlcG/HbpS family heme-binding protein n=1 Tax=Sphingobacterium composti TaxID=363260 RepID=UPI001356C6C8|nr:heme-binding protein [Sphingobacterium composti Ten et al. 2007 non Yoo et al. 2007]